MEAPVAPPVKVRSDRKPPLPDSSRGRCQQQQNRRRGRLRKKDKVIDVENEHTNEQTNMHDAVSNGHVKLDILQACGLRSRPVHTGTCCPGGHVRRVDDKVANLAVKVVYGNPIQVFRPVGIAINQTKSCKVGSSLESRRSCSISDEHSKVVRDDGRRDEVCACWEVYNCRSGSSRSLMSISWDSSVPRVSLSATGVEPSHTHPLPQRFPPAVMAALMAAVSSVTPSPDPLRQYRRLHGNLLTSAYLERHSPLRS
jgi:hypothetical protein